MRYANATALLAALLAALTLGFLAPAAAAQDSGPEPFVPVPARPKAFVPQQHVPRAPAPRQAAPRTTRGGLIGVPAKLPNVLGRNRTLPIDRRITLPGLPEGQPGPLPVFPVGGVVVGGSDCIVVDDGVFLKGRFTEDDLKFRFHLGGPSIIDCDQHDHHHHFPTWRYPFSYGSWYRTGPIDGLYTQPIDYSLITPPATQTPAPPAQPARELTALEKAQVLMSIEELDAAIEAYREHLDQDPEDVEAMRALGVAMLEDGRLEDGVAMVALAYRTDPMLARSPLDLHALGLDDRRFDNLLARVLGFARRTDSGSAHLVGAVLLQADGKISGAARVLARSEDAGLEAAIADAMDRELGRAAHR